MKRPERLLRLAHTLPASPYQDMERHQRSSQGLGARQRLQCSPLLLPRALLKLLHLEGLDRCARARARGLPGVLRWPLNLRHPADADAVHDERPLHCQLPLPPMESPARIPRTRSVVAWVRVMGGWQTV